MDMEPRDFAIQICFAGKGSDLKKVREELKKLVIKHPDAEIWHCFLTRAQVEEKGFSTEIVDLLEEVVPADRLKTYNEGYTFDQYMKNINNIRLDTAKYVDSMYVLDSKEPLGVQEEIRLNSQGSIQFIR